MYPNLKAKNLVVESFRGINSEISLDLKDFTIIYGENGTGKSSFVNALEFLFVKKLGFLGRQGIKKTAYVNEMSSKGDINIELSFDEFEYIRLKGNRKLNSPYFDDILDNPFVKNASFIVNRERLLKFVEGTPGNRYKAVMDLLNIKKLDSIQQELSPSIKELQNELNNATSSFENDSKRLEELKVSRNSKLETISSTKNFNSSIKKDIENYEKLNVEDLEKLSKLSGDKKEKSEKLINEINELLKIKDFDLIEYDTDINKYVGKLYSAPIFSMDAKIEDFNKEYDNLNLNIENKLNDVLNEYENVASDSLKSSQYLLKTLEYSLDYIKVTNPDNCPICNNGIDSSLIVNEISDNISKINSSNDALNGWKDNLKEFLSYLDDEIKKYDKLNIIISDINKSINNSIENIDLTILNELKSDLEKLSQFKIVRSELKSDLDIFFEKLNLTKSNVINVDFSKDKVEYENIISKLNDLNNLKISNMDVDNLENQINQRKKDIEDKTKQLEVNEIEIKKLEEDLIQNEKEVKKLEEYIGSFDEKIAEKEKQVDRANKIFDIFTKTKEDYIDEMLEEIRDDIKYFYDYIHDDDEILSPDVVVSGAKKIDVQLDSFGEYVDSRSFASEGHLDTLGFCIFLAFNKQFNNLGFIVLDDVLTTVDIYHKERIARLLLEEFEGFQFFITAHNRSWVDELESLCVELNRENIIYEIEDWSLEDGPSIIEN